ncbi:Fascin-like protein [Pandoravirus macleodensis]|uniref:Fascin-like protein n=1 Tax=Pandoravirus macleodensis TaxID=2107707 RepID=A0A2U7UGB5_9VIRU|nr:Fascin-like protein [Pandoravirus macleodensis]AVK77558.1 Fascin-like protein [Pandoravirus macleodensis]
MFAMASCLLAAACLLAVFGAEPAGAVPVCTYRVCSCSNKECTIFSGCTSYTQQSGTCGSDNRICNCATGKIVQYASAGCTGTATTFSAGSCYGKSKCYYIDSCAEPSATPSPSMVTPSSTPMPLTQVVGLRTSASSLALSANQTTGYVVTDQSTLVDSARWTLTRLANGKFTIKSFYGRYLSAQSGGSIIADRLVADLWEQFEFQGTGGHWSIKTYHGAYMVSDATKEVYTVATSPLYWTLENVV